MSSGASCPSFKIFQPAVPEIFLIFPVKVGVILENLQKFKVVKNRRVFEILKMSSFQKCSIFRDLTIFDKVIS
jgi:hypothetical protein